MSYETVGVEPDLGLDNGYSVSTDDDEYYHIFICSENPAANAFTIENIKFKAYTDDAIGFDTLEYKIATFDKISTNTWDIVTQEASWHTLDHSQEGERHQVVELEGSLSLSSGDYIGVIFHTDASTTTYDQTVGLTGDTTTCQASGSLSSIPSSSFSTSNVTGFDVYGWELITGGGVGGAIKYACHSDTGVWSDEEVIPDTWGYIRPTDFELVGTYQVYCTITPPWDTAGTYTDDVIFTDGVAKTIDNEDDEYEHWKLTFDVSTLDSGSIIEYTECWWRDNENGDVYVAEDGDDNSFGSNWDNPFASIEKGFGEVADGKNIYIESGLYSETLANLDVASGNDSCKLVPMHKDHVTSKYANVAVGTGTITEVDRLTSSGSYSILQNTTYYQYRTVIDRNISLPVGIVQTVDIKIIAVTGNPDSEVDVKLIHFRPDGDTLHVIEKTEHPIRAIASVPGTEYLVSDIYCGFNLLSGDFIGIETKYVTGSCGVKWNVSLGSPYDVLHSKGVVEITGDTSISTDWWNADRKPLMKIRYFA